MSQVAELKALLPEIITFAYVPRNQIQVNLSAKSNDEPDFSAFSTSKESRLGLTKEPEHVLLLEFAESWKGTSGGSKASPNEYFLPATRTPAATKKLVEKRNDRFIKAVDELLAATSSADDPVSLLQAAAREHIPVDPAHIKHHTFVDETMHMPIPNSEDRASIHDIFVELKKQHWYQDQIVDHRIIGAREGQTGSLDPPLSATIQKALQSSRNITSLYSHQTAAISALDYGKDVIVSTSTASGKSVIYQVPLLRLLENDRRVTAIFVYPTKALAQDQKTALENLLGTCPGLEDIQVSTYDGDTPTEHRAGIRASASVIFTNFDMIHAAILPHEELWRSFLKNLKLFVADELHYYSGTFGSHVALIMRRFRRVCAAIGNDHIRFVSCSATIANPLAHMVNIFGLHPSGIQVVTEDGAPTGLKEYLIWRSPYVDEHDPALGRQSSIAEATALMRFLMKRGIRVILFCKDRRRIEHDAFTGHLLGIIATNALELGVDIGVLDAVLMLGFPVTLASFRQQAGRAGRRKRDSLAVFIAEGLPIDQYYLNNPNELFDKDTDDLIIDLDNKIILEGGVQEDKYVLVDVTKSVACAKILEEIEISRAIFEVYEGGVKSIENICRHNVILDVVDVESCPWIHETVGLWMDVPDLVLQLLRDKRIKPAAAIHSAEHAFLNRFPLASDIRTECKAEEKEYLKKESRRKRPARLIMYDPVGHGSGVAAKAFDHGILSPLCKEGNIVSSKTGALAVLKAILNIEIDPDSIPFETDDRALCGHDSIISVSPVHNRTARNVPIESDSIVV
ncbi:hypothetical protein HHX47_DHR1000474 [Lentinula edodes]|nr:hypothetical protein HHX47_DHR1000474 [Lentinula edodes]